jgi:glycerol-3-phosphate dehydrogenase
MVNENNAWARLLHPNLPYTAVEVVWAARHEMARTIEDVLARRTRALLLDARASIEMASAVADLLATELDYDDNWKLKQIKAYTNLAKGYFLQE